MGAPAVPINRLTQSVGFNIRLVTVTQVDKTQGIALAVDEQNVQVTLPLAIQRAKGPLPAEGERWIIDQTLGFWSFAAYIAPNASSSAMTAYSTLMVSAPAWIADSTFHSFPTDNWPQIDIVVPSSGGIEVDLTGRMFNGSGTASNVAISCNVSDLDNGGALVFSAGLDYCALRSSIGLAASSNDPPRTNTASSTTYVLVGGLTPGHTVRVKPAYRFSSLTPGLGNITQGRITVQPSLAST